MSFVFVRSILCFTAEKYNFTKNFSFLLQMSGIKHRPLTSTVAGDSEDNYTDDESTPLTHDIYNGRYGI